MIGISRRKAVKSVSDYLYIRIKEATGFGMREFTKVQAEALMNAVDSAGNDAINEWRKQNKK